MATSRADLDLPRDESTEESCALVSSKELAKRIEEASGSSTPTEHAAWLKWASLGLPIFQNYCLTKRRVVACLAPRGRGTGGFHGGTGGHELGAGVGGECHRRVQAHHLG